MKNKNLYNYILGIADNSLILAQRMGELCGHGPTLETDIACTNISLDLFGQVRSYFQYATKIADDGRTEDDIAMLRKENEYKNVLLVEQPNTNFAYTIGRQFLFDVYHRLLLEKLLKSKDETIKAIASKSIKEVDLKIEEGSYNEDNSVSADRLIIKTPEEPESASKDISSRTRSIIVCSLRAPIFSVF